MASQQVLDVVAARHVFDSDRPFQAVLDGIFSGITRPDIGPLLGKLAASTSYEQFSSLVRQVQGSAGLMLFLQLDLDAALALRRGAWPLASGDRHARSDVETLETRWLPIRTQRLRPSL
jgi:hypothetical protein